MNIKGYLQNDLFMAGLLLLIVSMFSNLINFIFQFVMARMLDDNSFGILSFLTNLTFIIGVPSLAVQTIISKKTVLYRHQKQNKKISWLLKETTKKMLYIFPFLLFIFLIISKALENYTKIPLEAMILISPFILFALILPITLGIMQGLKRFQMFGLNGVINYAVKLILGVILVVIGFKAYGAIIGIVLGMFFAWLVGFIFLYERKTENFKEKIFSWPDLLPFIAILGITFLYSFDVLIAKFLFSSIDAGIYAKFSLLGKISLFSGLTIASVMFPLTSEKNLEKKDTRNIFKKTIFLISAISLLGAIFLLMFKDLIINLLLSSRYLIHSSLFLPIWIGFSFIALINAYVLYQVALDKIKKKNLILMAGMILLEIIGLILAKDINSFAINFMIISIINFILLILLDIKWKK